MPVDEHTIELDSSPVFFRSAAAGAEVRGPTPLYLHDVLTSSDDWTALLERTGGLAPDLIGFGRSGKGGNLDFALAGLAGVVRRLLDALEIDRVQAVGHGWGALVALELADRCERIALINPQPLTGGFEWSGMTRVWRTPVAGELAMGATTRSMLARLLGRRAGSGAPAPDPATVWEHFDQGTQRAVLRLHRHTDPHYLERRASVDVPVLLALGERDPELSPERIARLIELFRGARVHRLPQAGHWPWRGDPAAVELITAFLAGEPA